MHSKKPRGSSYPLGFDFSAQSLSRKPKIRTHSRLGISSDLFFVIHVPIKGSAEQDYDTLAPIGATFVTLSTAYLYANDFISNEIQSKAFSIEWFSGIMKELAPIIVSTENIFFARCYVYVYNHFLPNMCFLGTSHYDKHHCSGLVPYPGS